MLRREDPRRHGHSRAPGRQDRRHIPCQHTADRDARPPARRLHDGLEARAPQCRPGIRLRSRLPPWPHAPVVGIAGGDRFPGRARGRADDGVRRKDSPREAGRQVAGAKMDAGGTRNHGDIRAIVDEHGHAKRGDECRRGGDEGARLRILQAELHAGDTTPLRLEGQGDEVASGHEAVVGHEHESDDGGYIAAHAANQAPHGAAGHRPMITVRVTPRGAERWVRGHPWIYRSDVLDAPAEAGLVRVADGRGKFLGQALHSPGSEIRLRLLERTEREVDAAWWREAIESALRRRSGVDASAYRVVHGEGDGLPSLVVDRYDRWAVVQILSAGLETMRDTVIDAVGAVLGVEGILLRNDAPVRRREGLDLAVELARGTVPERIEVREGEVRYYAAPWTGQKTGAFVDQRPARLLAGSLALPGGRALDCFAYHGSFALHLARRSAEVVALDVSGEALARGAENAALNGFGNIVWREADAFEALRAYERARERFHIIALDPPAFAKSRSAVPQALRGYREINLRAMRILAPGGVLITASCSFHVRRPEFMQMLADAAADSGRRMILRDLLGQGQDHPELLTVPETGYLKGAILTAA